MSGVISQINTQRRAAYIHRDSLYVSEFCDWAFPGRPTLLNVRLGPTPREIRERYPALDTDRWARVWLKTCDAIVLDEGTLVLIEGELRRPIVAIGELVVYRELIPQTMSLQDYWHLPIRTVMVTPLGDPTVDPVLAQLQIETVLYRPQWAEEYLRSVQRL